MPSTGSVRAAAGATLFLALEANVLSQVEPPAAARRPPALLAAKDRRADDNLPFARPWQCPARHEHFAPPDGLSCQFATAKTASRLANPGDGLACRSRSAAYPAEVEVSTRKRSGATVSNWPAPPVLAL